MNCLIGVSVTLIAIVAGMLLLAKTQKDNLGNVFKAISYFVIISAFIGFLAGVCCGLCQVAHCGKGGCSSMEKCERMGSGMGGGCMMGGGGHCRMMGGMCGEREMGCGKMMKKCKKACGKGAMMGWNEEEEMEDINVEIIQKEVKKEEKAAEDPAKK